MMPDCLKDMTKQYDSICLAIMHMLWTRKNHRAPVSTTCATTLSYGETEKLPKSPNDKLDSGPNLNRDIFDLLLNSKAISLALTADTGKALVQILVD